MRFEFSKYDHQFCQGVYAFGTWTPAINPYPKGSMRYRAWLAGYRSMQRRKKRRSLARARH